MMKIDKTVGVVRERERERERHTIKYVLDCNAENNVKKEKRNKQKRIEYFVKLERQKQLLQGSLSFLRIFVIKKINMHIGRYIEKFKRCYKLEYKDKYA